MNLPALHAGMVDRIVAALPADARVEALLGGGSMVLGGFDEQSDLDLVVLVRAEDHAAMLADARTFAARFGSLLAAVLLVERNAALALSLADHGYVIETGRIVLEGSAEALARNSDVKEFYLGLNDVGSRKSYRDTKRYWRRKRWLS